jgi:acetoin utilization protein AcuB
MYPSIRHYMTESPRSISADESLFRARQMMQALSIRHLPVTDGERLVGIVTERDMRMLEGCGVSTLKTRVCEAMTPEPYVVDARTPLAAVARQMTDRKLGSAVITEDGKIVGIFSTTDALRVLAEVFEDYFSAPTSDRWGSVIPPYAPNEVGR